MDSRTKFQTHKVIPDDKMTDFKFHFLLHLSSASKERSLTELISKNVIWKVGIY